MSDSEPGTLLETEREAALLPPPPAYKPVESDIEVSSPRPQASLPLPTYEQSEKYEMDGVLEYSKDDDEEEEVVGRQVDVGTWPEFIIFFLVCSTLTFVGFIIAICIATTVAGQSGAVAGLGIALLSKPIIFEMYDPDTVRSQLEKNYCHSTGSNSTTTTACADRAYSIAHFCFWLIGFFGIFLFYKGTATFLKARNAR